MTRSFVSMLFAVMLTAHFDLSVCAARADNSQPDNPPLLTSVLERQRSEVEDVIYFRSNHVLRGTVLNKTLGINTPYGNVAVNPRKCTGVSLEGARANTEVLVAVNRNGLTEIITDRGIPLRIGPSGETWSFAARRFATFSCVASPARGTSSTPKDDLFVMAKGNQLTGAVSRDNVTIGTYYASVNCSNEELRSKLALHGRLGEDAQAGPALEQLGTFVTADRVRDIILLQRGQKCIVLLNNDTAELWDVEFSAKLKTFQYGRGVYTITVSDDEDILWGHCGEENFDTSLVMWNIADGQLLNSYDGGNGAGPPIRCISPKLLLYADQPTPVLVHVDSGARELLASDVPSLQREIQDLDISQDKRLAATFHRYGKFIGLWSIQYKKLMRRMTVDAGNSEKYPNNNIEGCSLSADGRRVVSCFGPTQPTILVWDARTGEIVARQVVDEKAGSHYARFIGTDGRIISSGPGGSLLLWDAEVMRVLARTPEYGQRVTDVVVSGDGAFAAAYEDNRVSVWSVVEAEEDEQW